MLIDSRMLNFSFAKILKGIFVSENLVWGGKHYVYVFRKTLPIEPLSIVPTYRFPTYDAAQKLVSSFKSSNSLLRNAATVIVSPS